MEGIEESRKRRELFRLTVLTMVIFVATYVYVLIYADSFDYEIHTGWAENFRKEAFVNPSYPIWHFLVYALSVFGRYALGGMPILYAVCTVTAAANAAVFLVQYRILRVFDCPGAAWVSFFLCFVGPFFVPWYNPKIYLGQGSPNVWHSPTHLMVKPFAVWVFFETATICAAMHEHREIQKSGYIRLSIAVFLSVLAKPSFFQGFVPALGLYLVILFVTRKDRMQNLRQYLCLCAAFIPGFLMVLYQFAISFYYGDNAGGIGIEWLRVMGSYAPNVLISLLLVLAFPLLYLLLNVKRIRWDSDSYIHLSLLFVFTSWMEYALLYEKGKREADANFSWASYLAYAMIWIVTTGYFFRDWKEMDMTDTKQVVKNSVLLVAWLLHLVFGLYYYFGMMTGSVSPW